MKPVQQARLSVQELARPNLKPFVNFLCVILLKAFEDRSLLPLIVLFMSHTGKNREQCPRGLENEQYADICLP